MSESVIFEFSRVENGGVGAKMSILVMIFSYMYGIFTNFTHFLPILDPWDSILGYIIALGV